MLNIQRRKKKSKIKKCFPIEFRNSRSCGMADRIARKLLAQKYLMKYLWKN